MVAMKQFLRLGAAIMRHKLRLAGIAIALAGLLAQGAHAEEGEIGRASCRERV